MNWQLQTHQATSGKGDKEETLLYPRESQCPRGFDPFFPIPPLPLSLLL